MPPKLRHECERCGHEAVLERAGRFRDEDYRELLQEYFALELTLHSRLADANERIEQLRELVNMLPDPAPEIELVADDSDDPFA